MKIEKKMVEQYGLTIEGIWVPYECLEDLESVDGYEGFESGALFDNDIERALVKAGIAHHSTRGSMFPTQPEFRKFMNEIDFEE